jgi:hypothetical protein
MRSYPKNTPARAGGGGGGVAGKIALINNLLLASGRKRIQVRYKRCSKIVKFVRVKVSRNGEKSETFPAPRRKWDTDSK